MSYRTNRRTGGIFRSKDYTPAELESQARRYTCPRCEAMMGHDISPASAHMSSRLSGHEIAGTPIASFISRAELNEHIRMMHPGQRFPTKEQRALGRSGININVNAKAETKTPTRKRRATKKKASTMTATEPETAGFGMLGDTGERVTEEEMEDTGDEGRGQGFTDDDNQVFDGDGGLL